MSHTLDSILLNHWGEDRRLNFYY